MTNSAKWLFNIVDDLIVENCIVKKKIYLKVKLINNNLYMCHQSKGPLLEYLIDYIVYRNIKEIKIIWIWQFYLFVYLFYILGSLLT